MTERAFTALAEYLRVITGSAEIGNSLREKDLSPQKLSYTIGTLLQVDRAGKQAILEIPTTTERLQHEAELLEAELQQLSLLAHSQRQEPTPPPYWSLN